MNKKKTIKPFIVMIWVIFSLTFVEKMLELMTESDTFTNIMGLIGILTIIYLSLITEIGLKITNINFKKNKQNEENN